MHRRDALKTIGGIAGAATLSRVLPGCHQDPVGITTYVYMMMENRSYDHYFGARAMVEGRPGDGLTTQMSNLDVNGKVISPWPATTTELCDLDPPHEWDDAHTQWDNGKNDNFIIRHQQVHNSDTAIEPMQYLTRDFIPVSYALADQYTTCDRWFCSVMGPTWPNRFYWHTGTSGGIKANQLPTAGGGLAWPSIYHRLSAANVDWAYYYGSIPVVAAIKDLDLTNKIRRFSQFLQDAAAGTLPSVVYIDPAFFDNDDHPPVHPINGQALIASVYTALAKSPQWKNCMLVITYDENGGFFDHVSPPQTDDDDLGDGFGQLGFRVPAMVIGPYVKESYISSVQYDHTSALRHLQNTFGLQPLTRRIQAANDLTDCIDMQRLLKGDWKPPIDIPTVNPKDWAMPDICSQTDRVVEHPVLDWADANPELIAGYDLRDELPTYRKTIVDYLAQHGKLASESHAVEK